MSDVTLGPCQCPGQGGVNTPPPKTHVQEGLVMQFSEIRITRSSHTEADLFPANFPAGYYFWTSPHISTSVQNYLQVYSADFLLYLMARISFLSNLENRPVFVLFCFVFSACWFKLGGPQVNIKSALGNGLAKASLSCKGNCLPGSTSKFQL